MPTRWITFLFCLVALPVQAQETGLNLLRIAPDAAASAMGDAQVAVSHDAFSTYWNPAGLAIASSNTAAVSHRIWVADVRTYAVAARFRAGTNGGLGLAVTATDLGEFEARDRPGEPDGLFSAQSVDVGVSYGRRMGPLRAGMAVRYLSERIFEASSNGYAVDVGVQLGLLGENLILGAAVQHLGEMRELQVESTTLPRTLRAGVAVSPFHVLAASDGAALFDLLLVAEVSHLFPTDETRLHAGASAQVFDLITARAGLITNDALRGATFGAGVQVDRFHFDYAFLPFESGFEGPGHVLSLHVTW